MERPSIIIKKKKKYIKIQTLIQCENFRCGILFQEIPTRRCKASQKLFPMSPCPVDMTGDNKGPQVLTSCVTSLVTHPIDQIFYLIIRTWLESMIGLIIFSCKLFSFSPSLSLSVSLSHTLIPITFFLLKIFYLLTILTYLYLTSCTFIRRKIGDTG